MWNSLRWALRTVFATLREAGYSMRLFVAASLDQALRKEALVYQPPWVEGAKLLRPELLHLTLQFIGEAEPDPVRQALKKVHFHAFETEFTHTGQFSPKKNKRILWLGLALNKELAALQRSITRTLLDAGINIDPRNYTPHITLARCKRSMDEAYIKNFLNQEVLARPFRVNQFHLYHSHNQDAQLQYSIIESYPPISL